MALTSGTRLGPYEISRAIGAGGMGEVYRARDTRLHRDVAIKVLPQSLAGDDDRLARFAREAQLLASLNHPGIAQIYGFVDVPLDVGTSGLEAGALAMELVEGEDLAARLARGAIPLDEALAIARQIAEALEYAHDRGIVHRDLKPANVKVMADGTVKLLDFGLAKAMQPAGGAAQSSASSPTIASPAVTNIGVILGTAAYMAPEQAKGKPVDRRADIWALGAVLFEMLAGRRLYEGETVTDTIAQVITQPPAWDRLPASTPAAARRILRRCLEKDPRRRYQSAGDVRVEIEEYLEAPSGADGTRPQRARRAAAIVPWALTILLAAGLLVALWRPWSSATSSPAAPMRLDVRVGDGEQLMVDDDNDGALAVLSPDGRTLVYAGTRDNVRRLYVRPLDSLESAPLSGTEDARSHFFSPDGRWVAFFAGGMLKKVAVSGGAPVTIAPATEGRGGAWGPDDTIVFAPSTSTGLLRVSAAGGTPADVTTPAATEERSHRWPSFLPDGNAVLFIRQNHNTGYDDGFIEAVRLDTKERKILVRGGTFPRYLASGHLVYVRENTLFAVPFDSKRLEVRGNPQPVLSDVRSSGGIGAGFGDGSSQVAFSSNGTLAYLAGASPGAISRLAILDRSGKPVMTHPESREFRDPRFAPDGKRLAVQMRDGKAYHVYVMDTERRTMTRVTFDGTTNGLPVWSPDGRRFAYFSDRGSGLNIYLARSDGTGEPEALTSGTSVRLPTSFSPKGNLIAGVEQLSSTSLDMFVLSIADRKVTPFAASPALEMFPAFSPDGRWIAYQSDESGTVEVYVRAYPGPGGKWQISSHGGAIPVWTKRGRELVYLGGPLSNRFMAVDVTADGSVFTPGKGRLLFETPVARPSNAIWFDASFDGNRFAVLQPDVSATAGGHTHITLVFGFSDEVRRALAAR